MDRPVQSELFTELRRQVELRDDAALWQWETQDRSVLVLPAKNSQTGALALHDDSQEITLVVGRIFHTHFGADFLPSFSEHAPPLTEQQIVQQVLKFVDDLLSDRIVIYNYWISLRRSALQPDPKPIIFFAWLYLVQTGTEKAGFLPMNI